MGAANRSSQFRENEEDIGRPYNPFNLSDVSFNGGSRVDADDFLSDSLKKARNPSAYSMRLAEEEHDEERDLYAVVVAINTQNINARALSRLAEEILEPIKPKHQRLPESSATKLKAEHVEAVPAAHKQVARKDHADHSLSGQFAKTASGIYEGGKQLFNSAGEFVADTGSAVYTGIADSVENTMGIETRHAVGSGIRGTKKFIGDSVETVSKGVHAATTTVAKGFDDTVHTVQHGARVAADTVSKTTTGMFNSAVAGTTAAATTVTNTVGNAWNQGSKALAKVDFTPWN